MALAGGAWGERTSSWANPILLLGPHTPILLLNGPSSSVCLVPTEALLSPTFFPCPVLFDFIHSFISPPTKLLSKHSPSLTRLCAGMGI